MSGPNLRVMAWRNLWRNRRRTLITVASLAFGVLLATLFTGISDWQWTQVINSVAKMGAGHITVQHPDYLDKPALTRTVAKVDTKAQQIMASGQVDHVVPRISGQVMLATAGQTTGAMFIAFDPSLETPDTFSALRQVQAGEMFSGTDGKGIILGNKLADLLGTKLGRKVVYTLTNKQGDIVSGLARVSGLLSTGSPGMDARLCLLPIDTVRKVLGYQADEATMLAVFVKDHRRSDVIVQQLNHRLKGNAIAVTWAQIKPDLAGFIAMKVNGMVVMEAFIMLLIAAGIFNTLFVSVMERLREFGVMMAIGLGQAQLFRLVLWESLWLALTGLLAGIVITALPYYLLATTGIDLTASTAGQSVEVAGASLQPLIKAAIYPENALKIAVLIAVATVLSGLYPAWRAGRVDPATTIKLI